MKSGGVFHPVEIHDVPSTPVFLGAGPKERARKGIPAAGLISITIWPTDLEIAEPIGRVGPAPRIASLAPL